MPEDLYEALTRFHREVVSPEFERLRSEIALVRVDLGDEIRRTREELSGKTNALQNDMLSHFDGVYHRFDRLESEHYALAEPVARLEAGSVTGTEFQNEIEILEARVERLE